ncbi:hypothetical protein OJF2_17730 [Aquisphaera giovannonii]|uniref:DUF4114 domain-containing protein n=1 Tax=Aquisphaera giovannonii TaxID=406548 RepID=A0A5B9VY88_9BACT|nr:hypothetical protein [Aquisphaera giovannonii]QEH33272.1 hypothetical protein OJF2_17730 [Aquisphaera giovannonii]
MAWRNALRRTLAAIVCLLALPLADCRAQTAAQPKVAPGPGEPDWKVILEERYGLSLFADLKNPVETKPEKVSGLFRKAGPGDVTYTPLIALGLPTRTRGGWFRPEAEGRPAKAALWSYAFKNTADDLKANRNLPPPMEAGSSFRFDPGAGPFGLWVSNDQFDDGGVFTRPAIVAAVNARLRKQPYKAMIYPYREKATGKDVPNSYLIGWEYSDNDDFQDVVCRIDNVVLEK